MAIDINKHEVDIDTLFKQNEIDLCSIKELYRKLKDLEKKISQIKYIDSNLADKLKKDYEKLKRIILDENIQLQLNNRIDEINIQLNNIINEVNIQLNNVINEVNIQLDNNNRELANVNQNLQKQIAALKAENEALKAGQGSSGESAQIAELNAQIAELQKQLAGANNSDITLLRQQITTLEAQLAEKTRIAESLRVELEALRQEGVRSDEDVTQVI